MTRSPMSGTAFACAAVALWVAASGVAPAAAAAERETPAADWLRVDYAELVDGRRPSHSGETVGELLARLGGRPLPPAGERPADRGAHGLLDPLVEPEAFALVDAIDTLGPAHAPPFVEVGSLWTPGQAQPAWVELLRARRYVVESDGAGRMRVFLPWEPDDAGEGRDTLPRTPAKQAVRSAWDDAWPVLRHVLAAERRRLAASGTELPPLTVEAHVYRHFRERSLFLLALGGEELRVTDTRSTGRRPPLDLEELRGFLESGLALEGGRLDPDGTLHLLGSRPDRRPTVLGRPLEVSDFAVAYRAVFHGGLAEPYMSLDRGFFPEESIVNYGGRLRDTALGLVSLRSDARFKTFSLGLDVERGTDRRTEIRGASPGFRTHLERLAADPRSSGLVRQQTRLWFYPDDVDLTLSPQGDVLVMRHARMSAASERFDAADAEEAPWTRATVDAINASYERLAGIFPELADLDQVVRLLALFTWLREEERGGLAVPDLASLLAVELPELPTPRSFPQLIAFNVLPAPGTDGPVLVVDRVPQATAEGRLHPRSGQPLDPRRRFARAVAALDRDEPQHAALLAELAAVDVEALEPGAIDLLAYRAGRTRLLARTSIDHYRRLLGELAAGDRQGLAQRQARGEGLRPITLGIGGLDLDMGQALARARQRQLGLGTEAGAIAAAAAGEPRESWKREAAELAGNGLPDHGLAGTAGREFGAHRIAIEQRDGKRGEELLVVYGADGPEPRSRKVELDRRGHAERFERVEERRLLAYRFDREGDTLRARLEPAPAKAVEPAPEGPALAPGLATVEIRAEPDPIIDPPDVAFRFDTTVDGKRRTLDGHAPRRALERVVIGPQADPDPGTPPPRLVPDGFGDAAALMVLASSPWSSPWGGGAAARPGEEDPFRIVLGLNEWSVSAGRPGFAVVGVDRRESPGRWARAPEVGPDALLLLPADAFPGPAALDRDEFATAWQGLPVAAHLPSTASPTLVVLVSAEAPGRLGQRLRGLARDPGLGGKLLAVFSLAGPIREDLAASLLAEGRLAGIGLVEESLVERRAIGSRLRRLAGSLRDSAPALSRVEGLGAPFVWHY